MLLGELDITFNNHLGTFHRHNLTGILIDEVLGPGFHHTGCQLLADSFLEVVTIHLDFLGKTENIKDILIRFISDGTEQRSDGEFLLTVDIGIHHIVDIGRKLHPRTLKRNDTS